MDLGGTGSCFAVFLSAGGLCFTVVGIWTLVMFCVCWGESLVGPLMTTLYQNNSIRTAHQLLVN